MEAYTNRQDLSSFLDKTIAQAVERHKLVLTVPAREYLVEMLGRFADAFGNYQDTWLTPITFQYRRITEQTNRLQRLQQQRELGDHCLFLVGYFYDFIRKHGEGQVRYHAEIGSGAYLQTGQLPFIEMGEKFRELYLVIGDLHLPTIDEKKVVEIYERWEKTRDTYYASLLMGKGIIPRSLKKSSN